VTTTRQIDQIDQMDHQVAPAPQEPPVHRHHRWRIAVAVVVGLVVLAAAIPTLRYLARSHPGAKSVSSAVQRYRASTSTTPGDAPLIFQGPRPGVYQATGSGTEKISFPPNSQTDGAVMPITVTALSRGCWRWHLDYNTAHWHEYDFCPQKGSLMLVAQRNFQAWDFGSIKVTNLGLYTCTPPAPIVVEAARPGQSFEHHCTGTNSAVAGPSTVQGPATLVGTVELTIGGQKVLALHQKRLEHLSGAQKGTTTEEWWFDARTGLPLRAERHYDLTSPSPIGTVTYNETGSWQLSSMQPTS
jgi:hypothetical protein